MIHSFDEESGVCTRCGIRLNDSRSILPCEAVDYEKLDTSALCDVLESFKDASPAKHQALLLAVIHRLEILEKIEGHVSFIPRAT